MRQECRQHCLRYLREGENDTPTLKLFEACRSKDPTEHGLMEWSYPMDVEQIAACCKPYKVSPQSVEHITDDIVLEVPGGTLDLGRLKIEINRDGVETVTAVDEAKKSIDGYCHPNVSSSGRVCFGEASEYVLRLRTGGDIDAFMTCIETVLQSFGPNAHRDPDHWHGAPCKDCLDNFHPYDGMRCPYCDYPVCTSCRNNCVNCGTTMCHEHTRSRDAYSYCPNCHDQIDEETEYEEEEAELDPEEDDWDDE